jgi:hypothetical protein
MLFLLSNLWLLYLISLVLMFVVILIVDHGSIDALIAAAVLELIPILGLWCTRSGYMVPAVVIAVLCCIAGLAGALVLLLALFTLELKMIAGGIIAVVSALLATSDFTKVFPELNLQIFLITACVSGMLGIIFVLWYFMELGKGMSGIVKKSAVRKHQKSEIDRYQAAL